LTALLVGVTVHGQVLHTVHAGTSGVRYGVEETPGSLYEWYVVDGGVISADYNDQVEVDWGITPGIYEIWVVETNIYGCTGDTVNTFVEVIDRMDFDPFPLWLRFVRGKYMFLMQVADL
jgi:hypothetical protein